MWGAATFLVFVACLTGLFIRRVEIATNSDPPSKYLLRHNYTDRGIFRQIKDERQPEAVSSTTAIL